MGDCSVLEWSTTDTEKWMANLNISENAVQSLKYQRIDGKCLLSLTDADFHEEPIIRLMLGDRKRLWMAVKLLQRENQSSLLQLGLLEIPNIALYSAHQDNRHYITEYCESEKNDRITPPISEDGRALKLPPEIWKAFLSFCYVVSVTWITAFVMVIVHDRVPDMKKYPPLPDIFLDNVPHIPWAFDMCEITGTFLFTIWLMVLVFHKHRFILLRRFFALSGTVFLLRCITMLITSLSVPGAHLQCQPRTYTTHESRGFYQELVTKISQAYIIWRGAGMSIQGVRTCGDYMFSGHTVALTMLNFFITEYTSRRIYFLHTLTWLMNMFGIFFILAAHEHYSIDVFVAFYITSRLFLYYHTLANNQALMQRDSNRTRIWFPLFSFFESSVDGIVPNEFETPSEIMWNVFSWVKEKCFWFTQYQLLAISRTPSSASAARESKSK